MRELALAGACLCLALAACGGGGHGRTLAVMNVDEPSVTFVAGDADPVVVPCGSAALVPEADGPVRVTAPRGVLYDGEPDGDVWSLRVEGTSVSPVDPGAQASQPAPWACKAATGVEAAVPPGAAGVARWLALDDASGAVVGVARPEAGAVRFGLAPGRYRLRIVPNDPMFTGRRPAGAQMPELRAIPRDVVVPAGGYVRAPAIAEPTCASGELVLTADFAVCK